jgi:hypothetical protein
MVTPHTPRAGTRSAHRTISGYALENILIRRFERTLTKDLIFQVGDVLYAIEPHSAHRLRTGMRINIFERPSGELGVIYKGTELSIRSLGNRERRAPVISSKDLNAHVGQPRSRPNCAHTPPMSHPWKRASYEARVAKLARP